MASGSGSPPPTLSVIDGPLPGGRATVPALQKPSTAAELRVAYSAVLEEHVYLTGITTAAALAGRKPELDAAAKQLQTNADELSSLVSLIYGDAIGEGFNTFWKNHIGMFIDYSASVGRGDHDGAMTSARALEHYAEQLDTMLGAGNPMPPGLVENLLNGHIHNVDHQYAQDWKAAYADLEPAVANMRLITDQLTRGVAGKQPEKFPGDADAPGASSLADRNLELQEQVALLTIASGIAVQGRTAEVDVILPLLRSNSTRLSTAIRGGAPHPALESLLNGFVDDVLTYARGVPSPDDAAVAAAGRLARAPEKLAIAFAAGAPGRDPAALQPLLRTHVAGLQTIAQAIGKGDWSRAYAAMSASEAHAAVISFALA